ncbi:MAG: TIGR04442 family protein [Nitrospirae bacterium]|nr:TIGR04442 family protein [Nitrospirota bacterium]
MIQDIRLHGQINDAIDYYATIAGKDVSNQFFYEIASDDGHRSVRFFSFGNEFVISDKGISYKGKGGSFCEYMFGVSQPIKDMIKKDVINRLIMYGTLYDHTGEKLIFTNETSGFETFDEVFVKGNALCNYYFFIQSKFEGETKKQQEHLLRLLGRCLKRSKNIPANNDVALIDEIFNTINDPNAILCFFKLVHRHNTEYYKIYKEFYSDEKMIKGHEYNILHEMAKNYNIDHYQVERIKIDVLYKYPDNKRIIDEYKDTLVSISKDKGIDQGKVARLNRLRSLSVRNNIPLELFSTLDELLLKGKKLGMADEPDYIKTTREILVGIFFDEHLTENRISKDDLISLLKAKQAAMEKRDLRFEGILLEAGKKCDEIFRDTNDTKALEALSNIVTFFDRFDATFSYINQIVFMEDVEITVERIRSILRNKKIFDEIEPKIFKELFIESILKDRYLTAFGRKKIYVMFKGLKDVEKRLIPLNTVVSQLTEANKEAILYRTVHYYLRKRMKEFYLELRKREDFEDIRKELSMELIDGKIIDKEIPPEIFNKVLQDLKEETVYLYELLPKIVQNNDIDLRERFLKESNLDRYYIEELEGEYAELKGIELSKLSLLQRCETESSYQKA